MSQCERFRPQINDLLDSALPAAHAVALSEHIEECEVCRDEYQSLKAVQLVLRSAPVPDGRAARRQAEARLRAIMAPGPPQHIHRRMLPAALSLSLAGATALAVILWPRSDFGPVAAPAAVVVARGASASGLPTAGELDEMTSLHALQSVSVAAGDAGVQQDTLADSTSRVPYGKN